MDEIMVKINELRKMYKARAEELHTIAKKACEDFNKADNDMQYMEEHMDLFTDEEIDRIYEDREKKLKKADFIDNQVDAIAEIMETLESLEDDTNFIYMK